MTDHTRLHMNGSSLAAAAAVHVSMRHPSSPCHASHSCTVTHAMHAMHSSMWHREYMHSLHAQCTMHGMTCMHTRMCGSATSPRVTTPHTQQPATSTHPSSRGGLTAVIRMPTGIIRCCCARHAFPAGCAVCVVRVLVCHMLLGRMANVCCNNDAPATATSTRHGAPGHHTHMTQCCQ